MIQALLFVGQADSLQILRDVVGEEYSVVLRSLIDQMDLGCQNQAKDQQDLYYYLSKYALCRPRKDSAFRIALLIHFFFLLFHFVEQVALDEAVDVGISYVVIVVQDFLWLHRAEWWISGLFIRIVLAAIFPLLIPTATLLQNRGHIAILRRHSRLFCIILLLLLLQPSHRILRPFLIINLRLYLLTGVLIDVR